MPIDDITVVSASKESDCAVVVIGRSSGEDRENVLEKGSYYITDDEKKLLDSVTKSFKKVIVLLNIGSIIDMSWLDRYKPGFLVKVKDAYGNNMAMYYAFAGMLSTVKTTQEGSSYEMARGVLTIIENFGVDVCQVNQFGVSAQMVYGRLMDSADKS
jgi:hypothetical protein